jgi:hypothetical protein
MAGERVVIVGGVGGGATCADAEIVILDRGYYVSFAFGLPYFVGNVIQQESKLLLASPDLFREQEVRAWRHDPGFGDSLSFIAVQPVCATSCAAGRAVF